MTSRDGIFPHNQHTPTHPRQRVRKRQHSHPRRRQLGYRHSQDCAREGTAHHMVYAAARNYRGLQKAGTQPVLPDERPLRHVAHHLLDRHQRGGAHQRHPGIRHPVALPQKPPQKTQDAHYSIRKKNAFLNAKNADLNFRKLPKLRFNNIFLILCGSPVNGLSVVTFQRPSGKSPPAFGTLRATTIPRPQFFPKKQNHSFSRQPFCNHNHPSNGWFALSL